MKWRIRRSSKLMRYEPITLIVALNNEDTASGMVYFDDEESFDYEETNKFYLKKLLFQKDEMFIASIHDEFIISNKIERIVILGLNKQIKTIFYENFYDGVQHVLEYDEFENNILVLKKLGISFDNLWKIKFEYI